MNNGEGIVKHEVATLEGALVDAAVAKAEGADHKVLEGRCCVPCYAIGGGWMPFEPSQDWLIGGPIIERERLPLKFVADAALWESSTPDPTELCPDWRRFAYGPTPLIAAMRAYVASKFDVFVDL